MTKFLVSVLECIQHSRLITHENSYSVILHSSYEVLELGLFFDALGGMGSGRQSSRNGMTAMGCTRGRNANEVLRVSGKEEGF